MKLETRDELHIRIYEEGLNGDQRDAYVIEACFNASAYYGWSERNRAKAFIGLSEDDVMAVTS